MHTSSTKPQHFDFVVMGAGPVGEVFGQQMAEAGYRVVIVEHQLVGGDCAYYACKPSKALLRPVQVAHITQYLGGVADAEVMPEELLARRDAQVKHYDDRPQIQALTEAGLTVLRGHAQLAGERVVEVHSADAVTHVLHAARGVVLTSGSTPNIPGPFHGIPVWSSKDATAVQEIPERLIVVGGGAVACEAATWMAALGSHVTMLVRGGALLAGMEPMVSDILTERLTADGIDVQFFTEVRQVRRPQGADHGLGEIHGGSVTVETTTGDTFEADELLLATGQRPDLDAVNLASVGLVTEDVVAHRMPDWLYALGDASGEHQLTHMGKYQARLLAQQLQGRPVTIPQDISVPTPQVVFTDPQIAHVGLTEAAASEAGFEVLTAQADFAEVAGAALLRDDVVGQAKIVVDRGTRRLLGVTLVGPESAEMLHAATIAVTAHLTIETLRHAVPVFPTAAEIWVALVAQVSE